MLPLYGLSLKKVEHLKPWFLAEALSSRTLEMAGFSDRLGIDLYFYHKAKAAGKPVLGLETLRDQAEIFDQFNDEQNEQYLLSTLSGLPAYAEMIRQLVNAWKDGNVQLLDRLLNQDKRADPVTHDDTVLQAECKMDAGNRTFCPRKRQLPDHRRSRPPRR